LCGRCLADPPPFDQALMPFRYAPPIDRLIGALKFRHDLAAGALLGQLLANAVAGRSVDCLLPVPLHPTRLRERGFNQAAELCRVVARAHDIPWDSRSLQRIRTTPTQHTSSRRERLRNLRGAFAWQGRTPPARVALIDDVVTTGATARAAAATLKRAGAEWVEIWAVARTPPPHTGNF
jgi:ComF family protein